MGVPLFFAFTAGMVATVNPCGFAMLPAYVSMFLTGSGQGEAPGVAQGLRVGGWVTSGFIVTFSLIGLITTAVSQTILDLVPWAAMVIGAALVAGGIGVLFGMKLKIPMFYLRFAKKSTPRSMGLFGAAYAVASISCTLPVFLAITTQAFAADSLLSGTAILGSYGLGMGVVLIAIAVGLASSRDYVVTRFRSLMPKIERFGGWLMIVAGLYIVYYWATNLAVPVGSDSILLQPNRIVERISAWFTSTIGNNPWPWLVGLIGVAAIAALIQARSRRAVAASLGDSADSLVTTSSALAGNVRGVDAESEAVLGRTQDEGVVVHYVEDEDAASGVPGRQNAAKVACRGINPTDDDGRP